MNAAEPGPGACLNCGEVFGPTRPRFCPACGQGTNVRPPTVGEFVQQFGGAYLATEGALWRSLKLLLTRPGGLTAAYLAGRRKHYVLPLRLYLTISVLVLLALRTVGGGPVVNVGAPKKIAFENRNLMVDLGFGRAGMREGVFFCEHLPDWACQRIRRRIDVEPNKLVDEVLGLKERFLGHLGGAMFVAVPSFALGLAVAYRNRRLRYTEHLVFALHVHAFWFAATLLMLPDLGPLTTIASLSIPVYTLLAMRRVYGGRLLPRLARAVAVSAWYGTTLGFALLGVGIVAVFG